MTKVCFFKRGGVYFGFEEDGHTGYADAGSDILCAALSAMTMLLVNTVEISYGADIDYTLEEGGGKITVKCTGALPDSDLPKEKRYAIAGLFQGYFYQLNDLTEEYYDYLEVSEKEA